MMHHILSAPKLVSSHCNFSDLHGLSLVLQHGEAKVLQLILKTVLFCFHVFLFPAFLKYTMPKL